MQLIVNGQPKEICPSTLTELIGAFCANPAHVVAEVNGLIVKSQNWPATSLKDGDIVELVTFVGGG